MGRERDEIKENRSLLITIEEVVEKKNPNRPCMAGNHVAQTTSVYVEINNNNEILDMIVDNTVIHEEEEKTFVEVDDEDKNLFMRILNRYLKIK
ncbi:hypothetical protein BSK59_13880 [Paenibacillus odorifer]|nr:hypothetical protein BSK59_13880 [Paenibacillus odorifer]